MWTFFKELQANTLGSTWTPAITGLVPGPQGWPSFVNCGPDLLPTLGNLAWTQSLEPGHCSLSSDLLTLCRLGPWAGHQSSQGAQPAPRHHLGLSQGHQPEGHTQAVHLLPG